MVDSAAISIRCSQMCHCTQTLDLMIRGITTILTLFFCIVSGQRNITYIQNLDLSTLHVQSVWQLGPDDMWYDNYPYFLYFIVNNKKEAVSLNVQSVCQSLQTFPLYSSSLCPNLYFFGTVPLTSTTPHICIFLISLIDLNKTTTLPFYIQRLLYTASCFSSSHCISSPSPLSLYRPLLHSYFSLSVFCYSTSSPIDLSYFDILAIYPHDELSTFLIDLSYFDRLAIHIHDELSSSLPF